MRHLGGGAAAIPETPRCRGAGAREAAQLRRHRAAERWRRRQSGLGSGGLLAPRAAPAPSHAIACAPRAPADRPSMNIDNIWTAAAMACEATRHMEITEGLLAARWDLHSKGGTLQERPSHQDATDARAPPPR